MSFETKVFAAIVFMDWRGLRNGDLELAKSRIIEASQEAAAPVVYLARVPPDHRVFTEAESAALLAYLIEILPHCSAIHHVLEGEGFVKSARRALMTNFARESPRPRDFYIHDSVDDAFVAVAHAGDYDLGAVQDALGLSGPVVTNMRSLIPAAAARASGAFRAASQLATRARRPPRKP